MNLMVGSSGKSARLASLLMLGLVACAEQGAPQSAPAADQSLAGKVYLSQAIPNGAAAPYTDDQAIGNTLELRWFSNVKLSSTTVKSDLSYDLTLPANPVNVPLGGLPSGWPPVSSGYICSKLEDKPAPPSDQIVAAKLVLLASGERTANQTLELRYDQAPGSNGYSTTVVRNLMFVNSDLSIIERGTCTIAQGTSTFTLNLDVNSIFKKGWNIMETTVSGSPTTSSVTTRVNSVLTRDLVRSYGAF